MSVGGILVIAGILILVFWSFWLGLIVALIGLVAFGGFVRGKWY
jgi:tetrahydromethanopterin S-methyltransferase subunit B